MIKIMLRKNLNICYTILTVERTSKHNLKTTEYKVLNQPQPKKVSPSFWRK